MAPVQTPAPLAPATPSALFTVLGERYKVSPRQILPILRDTAFIPSKGEPPFSDTEMAAALILAERYKLDPFAKEIYITRAHGKLLTIVPIDGWTNICNSHPQYDNADFEYIEDEKSRAGLKGITCIMWRKDRKRPLRITEWMSECYRDTGPWNSHPRRMLRHKAFIQAARVAFSLGGLMDEDEAARVVEGEVVPVRGGIEGRKPGYLPAPAIAPVLPEIKEVVAPPPAREESEESSATAPPTQEPGEDSPTEAPPVPLSDLAKPQPHNETIERVKLWPRFSALRVKLTTPQWKKLKEICGAETIEPSSSLDLISLAIDTAEELLKEKKA